MTDTWDTNHAGYRAIFNAALTGICANPAFFGPIMQQSPFAAVEFANSVVLAAIKSNLGEGPSA
jgi:hypothetical protein